MMNSAECEKMPDGLKKKLEERGIDPDTVVCWEKIK